MNPGANEKGVSEKVINSPSTYEPMANMRYGLLHTQLVDIQVPCNVQLQAGDVIKLYIENITQDNKLDQIYNEHRSGYYLILHLCHHFDTSNSLLKQVVKNNMVKNLLNLGQERLSVMNHKRIKLKMVGVGDIK